MAKNVLIIGAGAAGLAAAISAARSGADVTVLEAQERPGRKLLVTGNGRCNLTNSSEDLPEQYHGTGAALASKLIRKFDVKATLDFFDGLGLLTQEKNGYVYPYTAQSSSVLEVLLAELRRLKVKLKFSQEIIQIRDLETSGLLQGKQNGEKHQQLSTARFAAVTPTWTYQADAVILACGSKAAPSTGASAKGYQLAQMLGHTIIEPRPALVPLICKSSFLNRVAGVRCRAGVTLLRRDDSCDFLRESAVASDEKNECKDTLRQKMCSQYKEIAQDVGELQWTNYGVSGIVIFQLSRYMEPKSGCTDKKKPEAYNARSAEYMLCIDFFPDYSGWKLRELLQKRAAELTKEPVSVLLRGLLNEKMIPVILKKMANLPGDSGDLKQADVAELCRVMKAFYLPVTGTKSFEQAQICTGGVDCREITDTLESRLHSGLFFAGEMLDVDGPCGGYNLQWAWTSGILAGKEVTE